MLLSTFAPQVLCVRRYVLVGLFFVCLLVDIPHLDPMANAIDQLNMVTPEKTQRVSFTALDALQGFTAGEQIAGIGMMFLLVCQRHQMNPRDVLDKAARVLQDSLSQGRGEYVRAIKTYLKEEHQ